METVFAMLAQVPPASTLSAPLPSGLSIREASPRYLLQGPASPAWGRPQSSHGPSLVVGVFRWKLELLLTLQS